MVLELVVYDETEYFRDWDSDMFNYPYIERKTIVSTNKLEMDDQEKGKEAEYPYRNVRVEFKKSQVCLEPNIWHQFWFFNDLYDIFLNNFVNNLFVGTIVNEKLSPTQEAINNCAG